MFESLKDTHNKQTNLKITLKPNNLDDNKYSEDNAKKYILGKYIDLAKIVYSFSSVEDIDLKSERLNKEKMLKEFKLKFNKVLSDENNTDNKDIKHVNKLF